MAQWKINQNDQTYGPYTGRQIKQLVSDGKVKPETLLSKDGSKWIAAKNIKGVLSESPPVAVTKQPSSEFDEVVTRLREKLNEYSKRVPCHSFPDLGNQIQINDVRLIKVCCIEGTSWIEKRIATINRIGTTDSVGGRVPKSEDINSIRPWDAKLDQTRPPFQTTRDHKIPDLEGVDVCDECRGEGQIGCMTCGSKGQVICPKCNRAGVVNCSMCSGAGTTMAQRQIQRHSPCEGEPFKDCVGGKRAGLVDGLYGNQPAGNQICRICNGTGIQFVNDVEEYPVVCTGCAGNRKVACTNCSPAGVVTCSKCKGKTFLTCSSCNGQKHLKHTAVIKQSFTPKRFDQDHICELEIQSDTKKLVRKFEKRLALSGDLNSIGSELKALSFLIEPVQSEFAKTDKVSGSEQVLDRRLTVREASVCKVSYSLNGNDYIAFVGDMDCDFTSNPITHELAWSLSQGTSTSALAKGHKMAKECDECKRIVESASEGVSSLNKLMARGLSIFTSSTPAVSNSPKPTSNAALQKGATAKDAKPPIKEPPVGLIARIKGHPPTLIATICGGLFLSMTMCCCGLGIVGMIVDPEGFAEYQRQIEADQQSNAAQASGGVVADDEEQVFTVSGIKVCISSLTDKRIKFSKFEKTRTQIKFVVEGPFSSMHYFVYDDEGVCLYENAVNIEGGGPKARASILLGSDPEDVVEVNIN